MPFPQHYPAPWSRGLALLGLSLALAACSSSKPGNGLDSATVARNLADSVAKAEQQRATELRDSARTALASLLKDPGSATFDSLTVVQPPTFDGRPSPLMVCGRIQGKPGINGRFAPAAFVYQNRMTVFVEDGSNTAAFGQLWSQTCGHSQARVVLR